MEQRRKKPPKCQDLPRFMKRIEPQRRRGAESIIWFSAPLRLCGSLIPWCSCLGVLASWRFLKVRDVSCFSTPPLARDGVVYDLGDLAPGGGVAGAEGAVAVAGDHALAVGGFYEAVESVGRRHVGE